MDGRTVRSLGPILGQVQVEREAQLQHFDALDAKAGIILGFSGALVALAPAGGVLVDSGRISAVAAGLLALWTFWPRRYDVLDLRGLRDLYLASEPEFTQLRSLDTEIAMTEALAASLHSKAQRLKWSMVMLAMAAVLTAAGLGLN